MRGCFFWKTPVLLGLYPRPLILMHAFYADRFVRKRLTGFSGDRTPGTAPAAYSTHTDGFLLARGEHLAPGDGSIDWPWVIQGGRI